MSQEDKAFTAVLLPPAEIDVFTNDADTVQAATALEDDWRFARIKINVHEGGVAEAISRYERGTKSPDLVVIQTDQIDDGFSDSLENLAGYCAETTSAIVIGPVNDVNLYRQLVGMGVSDYLVRPVTAQSLGDDIAATILEKIGAASAKIIALLGSKGGVGTTMIAETLAWGLADLQKKKTFLMDAAGGWSTLSVGMDFEPSTTLPEAIRAAGQNNEDSLGRMMFNPHDKLTILSSGGDVMLEDLVMPDGYEELLDVLVATYPMIVVDLSGASQRVRQMMIKKAQKVLLVSNSSLPSIRASRTLLQEIKTLRGDSDEEVSIIVNQYSQTKYEVPKKQIEEGLENKEITYIGYDPDLFTAYESRGERLTSDKKGAEIARMLLKSAGEGEKSQSLQSSEEDKKGIGKLMGMLGAKS